MNNTPNTSAQGSFFENCNAFTKYFQPLEGKDAI